MHKILLQEKKEKQMHGKVTEQYFALGVSSLHLDSYDMCIFDQNLMTLHKSNKAPGDSTYQQCHMR
jgi:hypothetical protein